MPHDTFGSGEFRSTGDPRTGIITGRTFEATPVRYSEIDDIAIFEGDIAIARASAVENARLLPKGLVISDRNSLWPNGRVPYQIAAGLPDPQRVRDAIAHWQDRTEMTFVERTTDNANQYPDYLHVEDQGGCWSYVGRQGGRQIVSVGGACSLGNVVHELGHAIGLWHEQSREDRDTHVRVLLENILPGRAHNFDQHITDGDDAGAYDYGSIMHYPKDAFSRNGLPTIEPVRSGVEIGQRRALSEGDVAAVRTLYQ